MRNVFLVTAVKLLIKIYWSTKMAKTKNEYKYELNKEMN